MTANFDTTIDRQGTAALKWDGRRDCFGTDDVLPLWVADMDFASPEAVTRALVRRAGHPLYGYTLATDSVYDSLIQWVKKRHAWNLRRESMILIPGVVSAIYAAVQAFTKPGEGVIVQTPVYQPFHSSVLALERRLVLNPLRLENERYTIDFDHLERCAAGGAKLLIFCSPHNPVGRVWNKAELSEVLKICRRHKVVILSDEIYQDLVYPGHRHTPLARLAGQDDAIVTAVSPNKTFNLSGLGLSALIASDPAHFAVIKRLFAHLNCDFSHDTNPFSLLAFETAYREGGEWLDQLMKYIAATQAAVTSYFADHVPAISVISPASTFLLWLDCRKMDMSDADLKRFFIEQAKIGLSPGTSFGDAGSGFMRMNIGAPRAVINRALHQIGAAMETLLPHKARA